VRTKTTALAAFLAVSSALAMGAPDVARAQPTAPAPAAAGDVASAKAKFDKGKALFTAKNYADALAEFRASYGIVKSPNSHFFIANCLRELGRLAEAHIEYDRVAAEARAAGEQYEGAIDAALAERDALTPKIVLVNVTTPVGHTDGVLTVGGLEVTSDLAGKPIPAMPGNIEVILSASGKAPISQTVTGAAGETKSVTLEFPKETTPGDGDQPSGGKKFFTPLRIGALAAAGVGVVGMVIFAVQGTASNETYDRLQSQCGGPCPSSFAADIDKGRTQQTVANVGLGLGIVGLGAGAALFVLSMKKQPDATQPQTTWLIGPGSLGVRGTF
jgi:hypothetical protein